MTSHGRPSTKKRLRGRRPRVITVVSLSVFVVRVVLPPARAVALQQHAATSPLWTPLDPSGPPLAAPRLAKPLRPRAVSLFHCSEASSAAFRVRLFLYVFLASFLGRCWNGSARVFGFSLFSLCFGRIFQQSTFHIVNKSERWDIFGSSSNQDLSSCRSEMTA